MDRIVHVITSECEVYPEIVNPTCFEFEPKILAATAVLSDIEEQSAKEPS